MVFTKKRAQIIVRDFCDSAHPASTSNLPVLLSVQYGMSPNRIERSFCCDEMEHDNNNNNNKSNSTEHQHTLTYSLFVFTFHKYTSCHTIAPLPSFHLMVISFKWNMPWRLYEEVRLLSVSRERIALSWLWNDEHWPSK
jgi:hypothetical protein